MRPHAAFLLTTGAVVLTRLGDGLSTHLVTPDLSRETNPLAAGGWPALICRCRSARTVHSTELLLPVPAGGQLSAGLRTPPWSVQETLPRSKGQSHARDPPEVEPLLPLEFRHGRQWLVRLLARRDCFVLGMYRRHMRTIGCLGRVDRLFDVPVTTRNWNTITAVAALLERPAS